MQPEYFIHEVIVSDSKGKLYNFNSDYMNENFEVTEHDTLTPIEERENNA